MSWTVQKNPSTSLEEVFAKEGRQKRANVRGTVHGSVYYDVNAKSLDSHYVQQIAIRCDGGYYGRSFREYDEWARFPRPIGA
jgi:hypothetical protein